MATTPGKVGPEGKENHALEMALEKFVTVALDEKLKGGSTSNYQTLLKQLSGSVTAPGLCRWYAALSKCASKITSDSRGPFGALVTSVFAFDFQKSLLVTIQAYLRFLLNLALVNSSFMMPCLRVLVKCFGVAELADADTTTTTTTTTAAAAATDSEARPASLDEVHSAVHYTLKRLLELSPASASHVFEVIIEAFPHQRLESTTQQMYIKNMLCVSEYASSLRNRVLTKIIERLIHIDAEIMIEERQEVKEASDPFMLELPDEQKAGLEGQLAMKLDNLIHMIFQYLTILTRSDLAQSTFTCLMNIFERSILKTHKARFTPFLLFFHCSTQHEFADAFLHRLKQKVFDHQHSSVQERIKCCSYVASFVGRSARLRHASVLSAFELLKNSTLAYIDEHEEKWRMDGWEGEDASDVFPVGNATASEHSVFYAICQALLYIFVHRQDVFARHLDNNPQEAEQYQFDRIVESPFNPLRYCLAGVVQDFCHLSLKLELVDCRNIIRTNAKLLRVELKENTQAGGRDHDLALLLDTSFPFEPYLLPKSAAFVMGEGVYRRHRSDGKGNLCTPNQYSEESPMTGPTPTRRRRYHEDYAEMATPILSPLYSGGQTGSPGLEVFSLSGPVSVPVPINLASKREPQDPHRRRSSCGGAYHSDDEEGVSLSFSDLSFDSPSILSHRPVPKELDTSPILSPAHSHRETPRAARSLISSRAAMPVQHGGPTFLSMGSSLFQT